MNMESKIKITAILTPQPGRDAGLRALLFDMAPHCRAEPGNFCWDIWQEQGSGGRIVLDEFYQDDAAVAAHRDTPHYKNYVARINDLADRIAVVLEPAQVALDSGRAGRSGPTR